MKNKKAAIAMSVLVGIFTLYFILFIIYNFKYASSIGVAIGNILPTFMIFGVFSLILLASGFGGWGKILRKLGRRGEAENYEKAAEENQKAYDRVKTKYRKPFLTPEEKRAEKLKKQQKRRRDREVHRDCTLIEYEVKWESRPKFSVKNFLVGLLILVICGAVAGVMFAINERQNRKFDNPNIVETTAVVTAVRVEGTDDEYRMCYVYSDEDGNRYVFKNSSTVSGMNLKEGKTATVYYNKYNPEIAFTRADSTMLSVGAIFFLSAGVLVFSVNIVSGANAIIPIVFGSVFVLFGGGVITGLGQAAGLNLWETLMSGPFAFGCALFFTLGAVFVAFGLFGFLREIYYFALSRIKKHNDKKV